LGCLAEPPCGHPFDIRAVALSSLLLLASCSATGNENEGSLSKSDRKAVNVMREAGDKPALPRPVDFYIYFGSREHANAAAEQLQSEGFEVRTERAAKSSSQWLLLATKSIALTEDSLRKTQIRLEETAAAHGGVYDGWEAPIESGN
jgi:regulator of ribonuclease activity B